MIDEIRQAPLGSGSLGTRQTLSEMARLVRKDSATPYCRLAALRIVRACRGHDFACEISDLFFFCRDQIIYRRDPVEREWVQDTPRTLEVFRSGDCDDKVVCLASLLGALGHKSRFVVIGRDGERFTHVYLEVQTKAGWLSLDPTPEKAPVGWEARGYHRETFEIWPAGSTAGVGVCAVIALGAGIAWLIMKG